MSLAFKNALRVLGHIERERIMSNLRHDQTARKNWAGLSALWRYYLRKRRRKNATSKSSKTEWRDRNIRE